MKKIVITGMGAVTPVGIGVEDYWNNIIAGKSGIDTIKSFDPSELAVRFAGEINNFVPTDYLQGPGAQDRPLYAVRLHRRRGSPQAERRDR